MQQTVSVSLSTLTILTITTWSALERDKVCECAEGEPICINHRKHAALKEAWPLSLGGPFKEVPLVPESAGLKN